MRTKIFRLKFLWSCFGSLVRIFHELRGGRLFHEKNDYADKWRRDHLDTSGVVTEWESRGCMSPYDFWRQPDGPWRDVFVSFWKTVRDELATADDEQAWHYWGSPRQSNIFNKISLTILAADFFQSLCDRRLGVDEVQAIPKLVREWLEGVNRNYFNRDWRLEGIKKDTTGVRNRWSKTWVEYRKDPQRLPDVRLYRQPATTE